MIPRAARLSILVAVVALSLVGARLGGNRAATGQSPVDLGAAANFAVLAGSSITNGGQASGDVGVSPGPSVTGLAPGAVAGTTAHAAGMAVAQAQAALSTAYDDAANRTPCTAEPADLTGRSALVPGVYCGGALGLTGTITLNGQGNPHAVFIFQAGRGLTTAPGSDVALVDGARACNVFWQVGSSAVLGSDSAFVGTVMAMTSVTAQAGTSVVGRLLARTGAVTLASNAVVIPTCATTPPATAPTGPGAAPRAPTTTTPTTTAPTTTPRSTARAATTTTTTGPPAVGSPARSPSSPAGQVPPRGEATAYGCGPALAYLAAYEAPGFTASCPAYSGGHQATTSCYGPLYARDHCSGQRYITIADPCAAAYMNEASNSWVLEGSSDAPIDPYGYCH